MLNPNFILENLKEIKRSVAGRGMKIEIEPIVKLAKARGEILARVEELRAQRNQLSREPSAENVRKSGDIKTELKNLEPQLKNLEEQLQEKIWQVPNLLHPEVPSGHDDSANRVLRVVGKPPKFSFQPLNHEEIARRLDLIDFEAGAKVAGTKFYYLKNGAALLELALVRYALDLLVKEGFTPFITPDLAKPSIIDGIGFVPRGPGSNIYLLEGEELGLIGTAEITLGGYHAGQVLEGKSLPLKYAGFSHCFRREAGTYGKYTKGLYRVHQFSKVEMFVFCRPEDSEKIHQEILSVEEKIFQGLEIPYRVIDNCAGNLGAASIRTLDLEAWMPGRGEYGEITSTSNTTDYQARRLGIKYRDGHGEIKFVHTLNGTAVATSRALIAILENYQQKDGSVKIPRVLVPYVGREFLGR